MTERRVPPVVFIGGCVVLVVCAIAALAVFEASSNATGEAGMSDGEPVASLARAEALGVSGFSGALGVAGEAGSVRDQVARAAQHQDVGLLAMAPLYSPAVVGVELFGPDAERPVKTSGFFVGPGRVAVPRSAAVGAVRGEVLLDLGRRFEVRRVVADAPGVDLVLLTIDLPSELMRGLQVAFLEPLPGETLLLIGAAGAPGEEDPRHPVATATVERVRIGQDSVHIELEGELPQWSLGVPLLNESGKLGGYVARGDGEQLRVFGAERVLRLDPLPGVSLEDWTGGTSVESTRPPPETEDLWAEIRAMPRPEGFGAAPEAFGGFDVRPAKIERVEGGVRVDDRFVVSGSGTSDDPYVLPWTLLMSASETFNPSRGRLVLPERVTMFDGKWVRFEGNMAIPFAERFVSELLLMQHPWDGCCLGVPPTPYDAIEVGLASPIEHRPQFGVVAGRLKVDPFVRGQWLYGMYLMEDARLTRPAGALEDN